MEDYDPEGDDSEHAEETGLALDGDPLGTSWPTETYSVSATMADNGKSGVAA